MFAGFGQFRLDPSQTRFQIRNPPITLGTLRTSALCIACCRRHSNKLVV
jgi:hypothetical protein